MALQSTVVHDGPDCTITRVFDNTTGQTTQTVVWKAGSEPFNRDDLLAKAANALAGNIAFLAVASPSTAQVTAQVKALTRQVDALIRLAANQLTDTTGT